VEVGGSQLDPDPPEHGSEASAVQKPDQIDASFLWSGHSRAKGDGPLVETIFVRWIEGIRMERASGDLALRIHVEELCHMRQILAKLNRAILALARTEQYPDGHDPVDRIV